MAKHKPSKPELDIPIRKKKSPGDSKEELKALRYVQKKDNSSPTPSISKPKTPKPTVPKIKTPKSITPDTGMVPNLQSAATSQASLSRFEKFVQKVNSITDINQLKKMVYNRNYRIKKAFEKNHPEQVKENLVLKTPIINDIRHIKQSTFNRLKSMKDPDKLIQSLREILIDNTRRRNRPKTLSDYSNREQDYLSNAVDALQQAISNFGDTNLRNKISEALKNVSVEDINNIFANVPSYWAISEGYYYAVTDFSNFMNEIYDIIERQKDDNGDPLITLSKSEKKMFENNLFNNDPRKH